MSQTEAKSPLDEVVGHTAKGRPVTRREAVDRLNEALETVGGFVRVDEAEPVITSER